MKLTKNQADALCQKVVETLANWKPLGAALQNGGLEAKAQGVVATALEAWLADINVNLIVLPECDHIDFALIKPSSVGQPKLKVQVAIEVKFNYAKQANSQIKKRVIIGLDQLLKYSGSPPRFKNGYLLYWFFIDSTVNFHSL